MVAVTVFIAVIVVVFIFVVLVIVALVVALVVGLRVFISILATRISVAPPLISAVFDLDNFSKPCINDDFLSKH